MSSRLRSVNSRRYTTGSAGSFIFLNEAVVAFVTNSLTISSALSATPLIATVEGEPDTLYAENAVEGLPSGAARAALVLAGDAAFASLLAEMTALVPEAEAYHAGEFYRRELPPLRAVLTGVTGIRLLIVDGYVDLDPDGRPGLGAHAHAEFDVPVIGVAKTLFPSAVHAVPILRGTSTRPLFITAVGIPMPEAADLVRNMSGTFRLPDALRRVDALARGRKPSPVPLLRNIE